MVYLKEKFKIISNKKVSPCHYKLCLDAAPLMKKSKPGQFINIKVAEGTDPLFRRPFSVHRKKRYLEIFYQVIGKGTQILAQKAKGEFLDVMGPLGNHFSSPPAGVKQVAMIAGSIGVAPFLALSDELRTKKKYDLILLYGAKTKQHTFNMKEFRANGCKIFIATEDGSVGTKGRVDKLFSKVGMDPQKTFIYTCGPNPMIASVQEFALKHGIKGQASCEEIFGCGVGACLGCVIQTKSGYKTVCHDGPVFDLEEIIF